MHKTRCISCGENTEVGYSCLCNQCYLEGKTADLKDDNNQRMIMSETFDNLNTQDKIKLLHKNKSRFLIAKNNKYGDSALNPLEIFPVDDPETLEICVRLNDKLGRIKKCREEKRPIQKNDLVDVSGYIDLLMIKKGWLSFDEFID